MGSNNLSFATILPNEKTAVLSSAFPKILHADLTKSNLNAVFLSLAFIAVPILIIFFSSIFKKQLSKKASNLLYSFTIGFFLLTGFHEMGEGIEKVTETYEFSDYSYGYPFLRLLNTVGVAVLVLGTAAFFKFYLKFKFNSNFSWTSPRDDHNHHSPFHNHVHAQELLVEKTSTTKEKILAIFLLLPHRFVAGFLLGYLVAYGLADNSSIGFPIAFLVSFFLHLIPEEMIICYRLRQVGISWGKTLFYSLLMNFLLLGPTMFLGANLGNFIEDVPALEIAIKVMVGSLFFFTAIFEFLPEVLAETKNQKLWAIVIGMMILGFLFALSLINFHEFPHGHSHGSSSS